MKAQGSQPSADQKLEIMKRWEELSRRLEDFSEASQGHFLTLDLMEGTIHDPPLLEEIVDDDNWSDCDKEMPMQITLVLLRFG